MILNWTPWMKEDFPEGKKSPIVINPENAMVLTSAEADFGAFYLLITPLSAKDANNSRWYTVALGIPGSYEPWKVIHICRVHGTLLDAINAAEEKLFKDKQYRLPASCAETVELAETEVAV